MKVLLRDALLLAALLLGLVAVPLPADATIIGVSFFDESLEASPVVSIDKSTGMGTFIGSSGFSGLNSLARNSSGVLFSASGADLITINPTTGAGMFVAELGFGLNVSPDVRGLAFSPSGTLFAINNGESSDDLFTINVATGVGTLVGNTGFSGLQGLAFDPNGTLFGWDIRGSKGLARIQEATGLATDVNLTDTPTADIQTIAFAPDGTLFGAQDALFTIDPTTGATTLIGSDGYSDVRGIEILDNGPSAHVPEHAPVPEPSSLFLSGTGLVGLAAWLGRGRRR